MGQSVFTLDEVRNLLVFGTYGSRLRTIGFSGSEYDFAEAVYMLAFMMLDRKDFRPTYRSMLEEYYREAAVKIDSERKRIIIARLKEFFPSYDFSFAE